MEATHLEDLHKTSDIKFGIEGEIVYISNENRDRFFQTMKAFLKSVIRFVGCIVLFVCEIIFGAAIMCVFITVSLLDFHISRSLAGGPIGIGAVGAVIHGDKSLDIFLCVTDSNRKLFGLERKGDIGISFGH